jgi:hypothetical protein
MRAHEYPVADMAMRGTFARAYRHVAESVEAHAFTPIRHAEPKSFAVRHSQEGYPVLECDVTGLLAWWGGQPGQVGNEAATAVFRQCRGSGSSPSTFSVDLFCFSLLFLSGFFRSIPKVKRRTCAVMSRAAPVRACAFALCVMPAARRRAHARHAPCARRCPPCDSSRRAGVADTISR